MPDKSLEVVDPSEFTLKHYEGDPQYPTDADKRRKIKEGLDKSNFGISASRFNSKMLKRVTGKETITGELESEAILDGTVLVNCYYDGTSKTGEIKIGEPVAFDTVTGKAVTGVNEDWADNEYKILGTALESYSVTSSSESQFGVIAVRLSAISKSSAAGIKVGRAAPRSGQEYPSLTDVNGNLNFNRVWPVRIMTVSFTPDYPDNSHYNISLESEWVDVFNIGMTPTIPKNTDMMLWQSGGKWFTNVSFPMLIGTLVNDMGFGDIDALVSVENWSESSNPGGGPQMKVRVRLFKVNVGLKAGSEVYMMAYSQLQGGASISFDASFTSLYQIIATKACPIGFNLEDES